jgi:hypothetical protein
MKEIKYNAEALNLVTTNDKIGDLKAHHRNDFLKIF